MLKNLFEVKTLKKFNAIQFAITAVLAITMVSTINQLWLVIICIAVLQASFTEIKKPLKEKQVYNNFNEIELLVMNAMSHSIIIIGTTRLIYNFTFGPGIINWKLSLLFIASTYGVLTVLLGWSKIAFDKKEYEDYHAIFTVIMAVIMLIHCKAELGWVFWP